MEKRVLIFSPFGFWAVHNFIEAILGLALQFRGVNVDCVLCDGFFQECPIKQTPDSCTVCHQRNKDLFTRFGIRTAVLSSFLNDEERVSLRKSVPEVVSESIFGDVKDDLPVGRLVLSGVGTKMASSQVDLKNEVLVEQVKQSYFDVLAVTKAIQNYIQGKYYIHAILFSGIHHLHNAVLRILIKNGIPVLTHNRGFGGSRRFLFHSVYPSSESLGKSGVFSKHLLDNYNNWKNIPLSQDEVDSVHKRFVTLLNGKTLLRDMIGCENNVSYDGSNPISLKDDLNIPENCEMAVYFGSTDHESNINGVVYEMASQFEIIKFLCDFFRGRQEYLVIRRHPALYGDAYANSRYAELIEKAPGNVRFVGHREKISSYSLIPLADIVISAGSTIALEAHYLGKGSISFACLPIMLSIDTIFVVDDFSQFKDAFNLCKRLNLRKLTLPEMIGFFRAIYFYWFRAFIPLASYEMENDFHPKLHISSADELREGVDADLDHICKHIIQGEPLVKQPDFEECNRSESEEKKAIELWIKKVFDLKKDNL